MVSLLPSWLTRVIRRPLISQTAIDPSGSTTGPSGNSSPSASTTGPSGDSSPSASTRTSAIALLLVAPDPGLNGSAGRAAAVHERGIERHGPRPVVAERDEASVEAVDDSGPRVRQRPAGMADVRRELVCRRCANELLAGAGARDGDALVGPRAGADHRGVADAAVQLPTHAAGRRCGCKPAVRIERDRADSSMTRFAARVGGACALMAGALALGHEPARILEVERGVG